MSTLLTGIGRETCKGNGGLLTVYITELANVSGATVTSGVASFSAASNMFKKYNLAKEAGSNFTSTLTGDVAAGSNIVEQLLVMNFKRNQVAKRNELKTLAGCELVAVFQDNDFASGTTGNFYVIGLQTGNDFGGADVTVGVTTSGAQLAEQNGMSVTVRALETHPAYAISSADWSEIVSTGGVA